MKKDFETKVTGWAFILAAILLWGGWVLSPHQIGEYIVASDFKAVSEDLWYWIWMFRFHIFGWVIMALSIFAFASITAKKPFRVVLVPGAGMVVIGTMTLAIASAFYYNFGAWGVGKTMGLSAAEIEEFMNNVLFTNQYVTCFVRFGRVFSGVGLVLLGFGFIKWKIVHQIMGWFTLLLGFAAMGIIMGIPDNYEIYKPVFHIKVIWLVLMGALILSKGVNLSESES